MASVGETVRWKWGAGTAEGEVEERFERRVQRTLMGSKVVRRGSAETPALLIRQSNGARVLKLASELIA
jgi:hypothetical protein